MGELYCCSSINRMRSVEDPGSDNIGKFNFSKKYIIGCGGFSKVSKFIFKNNFDIYVYRFGKLSISKTRKYMQ